MAEASLNSAHTPIENTPVFQTFVGVCDRIWALIAKCTPFDRDTVGKQLVRAADSIGANLVEGDGRYGDREAVQFFRIARGSARETRYWLERAASRAILPTDEVDRLITDLTSATRQLNGLIGYRTEYSKSLRVREVSDPYCSEEADA